MTYITIGDTDRKRWLACCTATAQWLLKSRKDREYRRLRFYRESCVQLATNTNEAIQYYESKRQSVKDLSRIVLDHQKTHSTVAQSVHGALSICEVVCDHLLLPILDYMPLTEFSQELRATCGLPEPSERLCLDWLLREYVRIQQTPSENESSTKYVNTEHLLIRSAAFLDAGKTKRKGGSAAPYRAFCDAYRVNVEMFEGIYKAWLLSQPDDGIKFAWSVGSIASYYKRPSNRHPTRDEFCEEIIPTVITWCQDPSPLATISSMKPSRLLQSAFVESVDSQVQNDSLESLLNSIPTDFLNSPEAQLMRREAQKEAANCIRELLGIGPEAELLLDGIKNLRQLAENYDIKPKTFYDRAERYRKKQLNT